MNLNTAAKFILELREKDERKRAELVQSGKLSYGYNVEMSAIHDSNAKELERIMESIGFPTAERLGEEASESAWLIIQHSVGQPDFMKRCAALMAIEVEKGHADKIHFAYLTDRIAVFEGRPQKFGTQFDWDEDGEMSPSELDNYDKVNKRRAAMGLCSLEEQTRRIRERAKTENERPPQDHEQRKKAYDQWRRSVGWIK